jgi:hypothetical protein
LLTLRRLLLTAVLTIGIADSAVIAQAGAANQPALLTAVAGSDGQTDACGGGQHAQASPGGDPSSLVNVSPSNCQAQQGQTAPASTTHAATAAGAGQAAPSARSATGAASRSGSVATVDAARARGVVISGVQIRRRTASSLRILVRVRDADRRLVQGAIVRIGPFPLALHTISNSAATYTNRLGEAQLRIPVSRSLMRSAFVLRLDARTPSAHVSAIRTVRSPGQAVLRAIAASEGGS